MDRRALSIALTVGVVVSGALAFVAVVLPSQGTTADTGTSGFDASLLSPTPTIFPGNSSDPAAALGGLQGREAIVAEVARSILGGDTARLLDLRTPSPAPCEAFTGPDGRSDCEVLGLARGTIVTRYSTEPGGESYAMTREEAMRDLKHRFAGRHPRVDLVARRSDGQFILFLGVDPAPALYFPAGLLDTKSSPVVGVLLFIDPSLDAPLIGIRDLPNSSPPLEELRVEAHRLKLSFEVLAVSGEFRAREQASHDQSVEEHKGP